jgi:uncharacterized caspase-like protein
VQNKGSFYFAPWEADAGGIAQTCVPWAEVVAQLDDVFAKKLVFMDACHSGGRLPLGPAQANNQQLAEAARGPAGLMVLASCQGKEFSYEIPARGHGAFTVGLLSALRGEADGNGDGQVTLAEVLAYVPEHVNDLVVQADGNLRQTPHLVSIQDFNPMTPLAHVRRPALDRN